MTMHFCRARAESFPLWGPWPKEPGDPVFLCACGHTGRDRTVHRSHGRTDCEPCAEAQRDFAAELLARKQRAMLEEAGPRWSWSPTIHADGSATARIRLDAITAIRHGERWAAEAHLASGTIRGTGGTLREALNNLSLSALGCLDVDLLRVRNARHVIDLVAEALSAEPPR